MHKPTTVLALAIALCALAGCWGEPEVEIPEVTVLESAPFYQDRLGPDEDIILNGWYVRHRDPSRSWVVLWPGRLGEELPDIPEDQRDAIDPDSDVVVTRSSGLTEAGGPNSLAVVDADMGKIKIDGKEFRVDLGKAFIYEGSYLTPLQLDAQAVIDWNAYMQGLRRAGRLGVTVDPGPIWDELLAQPVNAILNARGN